MEYLHSSPNLPSSFDPAFHLHSEAAEAPAPISLPSLTHSDDVEALFQQQSEVVAAKTKAGIVIQHRAWKLGDVFRSEEDYPIGLTSKLAHLTVVRVNSHGPHRHPDFAIQEVCPS